MHPGGGSGASRRPSFKARLIMCTLAASSRASAQAPKNRSQDWKNCDGRKWDLLKWFEWKPVDARQNGFELFGSHFMLFEYVNE